MLTSGCSLAAGPGFVGVNAGGRQMLQGMLRGFGGRAGFQGFLLWYYRISSIFKGYNLAAMTLLVEVAEMVQVA